MKKETNNNFLTLDEIAEKLKLTRRTLYNYVKDGRLKAYKVGKQYRVKDSDYKALYSKKTV